MSNVHRLKTSEKIFFITTNLKLGERLFEEPEYQIIAETIAVERLRLGFFLFGYVLMPDHWHVLILPRFPLTVSKAMQNVKRVSSVKINGLRQRTGPLWQHQFWDRFIRNGKEFRERLDYLHMNPVRKGLAENPEQWRWSSCNNFSLNKATVAACPFEIDYVHLPDDYRA